VLVEEYDSAHAERKSAVREIARALD
jgi:hypothetical protein